MTVLREMFTAKNIVVFVCAFIVYTYLLHLGYNYTVTILYILGDYHGFAAFLLLCMWVLLAGMMYYALPFLRWLYATISKLGKK